MVMGTQLSTMDLSLPIGSLDAYIHRIQQFPLLSAAEEHELAVSFKRDENLDAARRLVMAHLRFVVKIARGYLGYGLSLADLIQEGNVGLMKAVKRFDPEVGVRLVSFAVHWIKAEIHEFILRNWRIVKVATTKAQRKLFFNLRSAKKRLGWFKQQEVWDIADKLDVTPKNVVEMEARLHARDAAFDSSDFGEDGDVLARSLADASASPAQALENEDFRADNKARFYEAFTKLDSRSQTILQRRWLDEQKATLQELAQEFNVSAERIRQLEQQAMQKIKSAMV